MNCENCEIIIIDNEVITCASCGGFFCSDHVKETPIGFVCIDDIEMFELRVITDES